MLNVAIVGANGRMGKSVQGAIEGADDIQIAGEAVDDGTFETHLLLDLGDNLKRITPRNSGGNTDVVVEFSVAGQSQANLRSLLSGGIQNIVVGTSGWSSSDISDLTTWLNEHAPLARVLIVPNFSISAVLQAKWAVEAAKYFNDAHIIEYHHKAKIDKPSGTALNLQDSLESTTGIRPEALSVRADGYMATQEVILTNPSERLKIEQDVTSREAFMPGVLLAVRKIQDLPRGVNVGLGVVM